MLKYMKNKGALFIEYALILAFVLAAGGTFVGFASNGSYISDIFLKVEDVMDIALNGSEIHRRNKVMLTMRDALDVAIDKAISELPRDKKYIFEGSLDSNMMLNGNASQKDMAAKLDSYVRDFLASKGIDPDEVTYWSIDRHYKDAYGGESAYDGYRFAWSTYNPNDYKVGDYMPIIQYTRHDKPDVKSEYISGCDNHDAKPHWEYQVGEKLITSDKRIEWDKASTKDKYAFDNEQDALKLYNERYVNK